MTPDRGPHLRGGPGHHCYWVQSSVSDWTESPTEIAAAERVALWHPVVATLRKENWLSAVDKSLRERGFGLLHSLARDAEGRGHSVRQPERNLHGYVEDSSRLCGELITQVEEIQCSLGIWQPKDRVPHTATSDELAKAKRDMWYRIPTHDYVSADRLSITLDTNSRYSSKVTWSDTKTPPLELRLPVNHPGFRAHLPLREGWRDGDQVRREHQGQGGAVGSRARRRLRDRVVGD